MSLRRSVLKGPSVSDSEVLLRTPLFAEHQALKARLTGFGGWEMPLSYEGQLAEHRAVRERCGIFDVSHMGQVRFRGVHALAFLQALVPADIAALAPGFSRYTQLLQQDGGVLDDLIVTCVSATEFFAVVNAGTRVKDVAWMRTQAAALGFSDVEIVDESGHWAMIAVQGPGAFEILDRLIPGFVPSTTPAFTLHAFTAHGSGHLLSRTGYTGEKGGELLCPAELAPVWWRALLAEGAVPCGLAARDTLRLEAGYCLYGNDLDTAVTPVEAGLSWSVGWKKTEGWIGREALEAQRAAGPSRKLIGLVVNSRKPLRHGDKVVQGETVVGEVTSGGFSPMKECGIAMAYVASAASGAADLGIATKTGALPAQVVKMPFVKIGLK